MDNREKQIEEIVKDFCPLYQEYGSCKRCNNVLDIDEEPCYYGCVANLIIDYGYRKASDVAREIFEEIDRMIYNVLNDRHYIMGDMCYEVAELKKKYIGEDINVTTKNTEEGK